MSFEIALSIAGFALSVAGLVPVFKEPEQRNKALALLAVFGLLGIFAYQIVEGLRKQSEKAKTREEIIETLTDKGRLPFDQLFQESYLFNYDLANEAIDSLIDDHQIRPEWVELKDNTTNTYRVRLYRLKDKSSK